MAWDCQLYRTQQFMQVSTVCPGSSDPFYLVRKNNGSLLPGHTVSLIINIQSKQ